jgi:hypothetical protein
VERRKRRKGKSRKLIYGIAAVVIVCFGILTYSFLRPTDQTNISQEFSYKAAIVDHLSLFEPNPSFNQTCTTILEEGGFTVDYYSGEEVTVNFYRNLPKQSYGLLILRVHSGIRWKDNKVCFFTSEPYSESKYVYEQLTEKVGMVAIYEEGPFYFGISPEFVKSSMEGRFVDTIVVMMGCDGLKYDSMAEAFIKKRAKAYISWNEGVLASHTDQATIQLLQHLVIEKQTVQNAVTETNKHVGPDPQDGSILQYYPDSANNHVIPNVASNLILNDAPLSSYNSELSLRYVHRLMWQNKGSH